MAIPEPSRASYWEPARELPALGEWDVAVCGGGPAGCAAALSAARHGAKTILIEKEGHLGGAPVNQLVCVVLSVNGVDFQGVWHEWMRALRRRNGAGPLSKGPCHIHGTIVPEAVKYAWDDLLSESGATLLHHAYCCGAIVEDGIAKGVLLETKAGRRALFAKRVVDCTGDGIVCHHAGVPWEQGDGTNNWAMALTKVFRIGNAVRPDAWPRAEDMERIEKSLSEAVARGDYKTPVVTEMKRLLSYVRSWAWGLPEPRREIMSVLSRILKADPLDPWDLTRAEREGRAQAWEAADAYRRFVPGCEGSCLLDTSSHVGVRSSRRIRGLATATARDAMEFATYPDEVAKSSWDIDVWPADSYSAPAVARDAPEWKARAERMMQGAHFSIRYGCLLPQGVDSLLAAGRCISAEHLAQSSLRIQQTCMATGQAAGAAAAMSLKQGLSPRELDAGLLVAQLERDRAVPREI